MYVCKYVFFFSQQKGAACLWTCMYVCKYVFGNFKATTAVTRAASGAETLAVHLLSPKHIVFLNQQDHLLGRERVRKTICLVESTPGASSSVHV